MIPIEEGLTSVNYNEGGELNAPVSEETLQTLQARYDAGDRELSKRIETTDTIKYTPTWEALRVW